MDKPTETRWGGGHETLKAYVFGFLLSIVLTVAAYLAVVEHLFIGSMLVFTIIGLGVIQALVQLVLFLHVGREAKPRWNLLVFLTMVIVVVIIVGGTLWIMYSLNERTMPPMDATYQLQHESM